MSPLIGAVLSSGKASLRDMGEWMSIEDCYDILEVVAIDAHNRRLMTKRQPGT